MEALPGDRPVHGRGYRRAMSQQQEHNLRLYARRRKRSNTERALQDLQQVTDVQVSAQTDSMRTVRRPEVRRWGLHLQPSTVQDIRHLAEITMIWQILHCS